MDNPHQSPESPGEPAESTRESDEADRGPPRPTAFGLGGLGFLTAWMFAGAATAAFPTVSPAFLGLAVGVALWAVTRRRFPAFGRGALVFAAVCSLVALQCVLSWPLSR